MGRAWNEKEMLTKNRQRWQKIAVQLAPAQRQNGKKRQMTADIGVNLFTIF